jgi:hypothetical protein
MIASPSITQSLIHSYTSMSFSALPPTSTPA